MVDSRLQLMNYVCLGSAVGAIVVSVSALTLRPEFSPLIGPGDLRELLEVADLPDPDEFRYQRRQLVSLAQEISDLRSQRLELADELRFSVKQESDRIVQLTMERILDEINTPITDGKALKLMIAFRDPQNSSLEAVSELQAMLDHLGKKAVVEFRSRPNDGAEIWYKRFTGKEEPKSITDPTTSSEEMGWGYYYFWSERDGEPTSPEQFEEILGATDRVVIREPEKTDE